MNYLLLNRDRPVLEFSSQRDSFEEPVFQEQIWLSEYRPIGYKNLNTFLERRKAPKHREHIRVLLQQYECDDMEGFLQVTHALSLNDTFWVKPINSTLTWDDVSLYSNEFDEVISQTAFDGTVSENHFPTTSPEFGTDGMSAKCWIREDREVFLYKTGSRQFEIEPLSEFLATQLASIICPSFVSYDLDFYHHRLISKCSLFTDEKTGFAPMSRIFSEKVSIPQLFTYFSNIGSENDFRRMCVLDALIFNKDRHFGNFGVLFNNENMDILCMAPVFDHNQCLFPHVDDYHVRDLSWYVNQDVPRLGSDFNVTANELLTPDIISDLKNLSGFYFTQHPHITAPQSRLDMLSTFVNRQIDNILGRIPIRAASKINCFILDEELSPARISDQLAAAKEQAAADQLSDRPDPERSENTSR